MRTALRMFADSNGRPAAAVTLAMALALVACGPAVVTVSPSPSRSGSATARPTLAAGMTRFSGKINDAATGRAIPGVCVIIGPPSECTDNMPHSDADGGWLADLPIGDGLSWTFTFVKGGYANATAKGISDTPGEKKVDVTLIGR